ncbi:MAG: aldehyde ferredoxin oxidoreductase family protein [Sulfolobales archaeon]
MIFPGQKVLRVDLDRGSVEEEELKDEIIERYVGGKGLAAYLMYRELKQGVDPLSPENKLFIFGGPLAFIYPTFTRTIVASKSPLTNTFSDSNAGGSFAVELRRAGYLGIVVEGASDKLVCLKIDREGRRLFECENLRLRTTYEVGEYFPEYSVLTIGPAGENLVRISGVFIDMRRKPRSRPGVAGRGGLGAVMGSKKLKAIIVRGFMREEDLARNVSPDLRTRLSREYLKFVLENVIPGIGVGGNLPVFRVSAEARILPVKNFRQGIHEGWEQLVDDEWAKIKIGKLSCPTCPVACGARMRMDSRETERIEYETVAMNGSNLGITDKRMLIEINNELNELGLDSISAGSIAAFVAELSERGLIDLKIKWGDAEAFMKLYRDIAYRSGLGDILAEGIAHASKYFNAEEIALHIKGLDIPAYDPRGVVGMSLAYATADRGGDHLRAWTVAVEVSTRPSIEDLVKLTINLQNRNAALWTLVACDNIVSNSIKPPEPMIEIYIKMLNSLGFEYDMERFLELGERIYNIARMFNAREGFSRRDDKLPPRFYERREDTGWYINRESFEKMLDRYYQLRGWSDLGIPTPETLRRLGIEV